MLSDDDNGIVDALDAAEGARPCCSARRKTLDDELRRSSPTLGQATGHADEAARRVADVKDRITRPPSPRCRPPAKGQKVYHELDQTFFSATSNTFIGSIYTLFGLQNIADEAKGADSGYPQLSAEYVVKAGARPDRAGRHEVLRADRSRRWPSGPRSTPIPAVKNGKVLAANDDVVSRWGPRVGRLRRARRRRSWVVSDAA